MLKRELKINIKSLLLWLSILIAFMGIIYLIYPSIIGGENASKIADLIKIFPPEVLKAFNMDIASLESVFGWLQTEGWVFILLILSTYSAILGSNILLKEESDKTIEFLYSKPISRKRIVTSKILCGIINIFILNFGLYLFNLLGLYLSNDLNFKLFTNMSLYSMLIYYAIFFICLLISTFFKNTKKTIGLCIAIVFVSYILQMIGNLGDKYEFIKYFSLFELAPTRYIIENNSLGLVNICVGSVIIIASVILTYVRYNRKEFLI